MVHTGSHGYEWTVKYLSAASFGINVRRLVGQYPTLLFESLGKPPGWWWVDVPPSTEITTLFVIETGTTKSGR